MKNKALMIHHDYYEVISLLSDEEKGKLLSAIFEYDINFTETEFEDRTLLVLFKQIKRSLDANREHYESTCKKRGESAKKRWDKNANAYDEMQLHANADNEKEKENVNVNENEKENVNVNEKQADCQKKKPSLAEACDLSHTHKKPYGEFKNVFLSDEEYGKLIQRSSDYLKCIESFSAYMKSSGKSYEDHYAALLNWKVYGDGHSRAAPLSDKRAKPPGERREPTFDVSEFTKKAIGIKYVPPEE